MKTEATHKLEENFSKLENMPLAETKKLFTDYLQDRYRFTLLPFQGDIDVYINHDGGRKNVWDILCYYKKLLEIKNNPKYIKIFKYANVANYNQLFFDGQLFSLDPRYQYANQRKL